LPLLYSNAVLKGESRKFLRLVVNGKSCDECAAEREGFEPSVQVLARITV
jgi:hypothetical protein